MRVLLLSLILILPGCNSGSWWQAKLMSGADTRQAIALEKSQDPKICMHVRGNGSAMGIDGFVEIIEARGKKVSFQDCLNAFNRTISPITLP